VCLAVRLGHRSDVPSFTRGALTGAMKRFMLGLCIICGAKHLELRGVGFLGVPFVKLTCPRLDDLAKSQAWNRKEARRRSLWRLQGH
jgi:hypothetical protein